VGPYPLSGPVVRLSFVQRLSRKMFSINQSLSSLIHLARLLGLPAQSVWRAQSRCIVSNDRHGHPFKVRVFHSTLSEFEVRGIGNHQSGPPSWGSPIGSTPGIDCRLSAMLGYHRENIVKGYSSLRSGGLALLRARRKSNFSSR